MHHLEIACDDKKKKSHNKPSKNNGHTTQVHGMASTSSNLSKFKTAFRNYTRNVAYISLQYGSK